jgi:para-aminobenzoate synthetase/4-amino-4-deoxychorismate lyase
LALKELKDSGANVAGGAGYPDLEGRSRYFWGSFTQAERVSQVQVKTWSADAEVFCSPKKPHWTFDEYARGFERVREALRAGDSYQVNLTFRYSGQLFHPGCVWNVENALKAWLSLLNAGQGLLGCFADLGDSCLVGLSPELLWERQGERVICRPMKGTALRKDDSRQDEQARGELRASSKVQAENLMIVDMVRNDLGQLAHPGSVKVPHLFDIEALPTVWQMTSQVQAVVSAPDDELWCALFPAASITGAPKKRTRELIQEVEKDPRGWYCGSAGWIAGEYSHFNVLIRTLELDSDGRWTAGTGGGIVWDSDVRAEWQEAWDKTLFIDGLRRPFGFVETLLWTPKSGWVLRERHLDRLRASVLAFHEDWDEEKAVSAFQLLEDKLRQLGGAWRVRWVLTPEGVLEETHQPFEESPQTILKVALAQNPLGPETLLYRTFKTTQREVYESARIPGVDQIVHFNERNELTETTTMNLTLRFGDRWLTPALSCGLLAGTLRAELLEKGELEEAVLPTSALFEADEIRLMNSVRGRVPAIFLPFSVSKPDGSRP